MQTIAKVVINRIKIWITFLAEKTHVFKQLEEFLLERQNSSPMKHNI